MKSLTTIVAALTLGSLAFAADEKPAPPPAAPPAEGDKKPGGPGGDRPRMTPEEAFKKLDADGDGSVTLAEFKASPMGKRDETKAEERYKKLDANGDGKMTLEEFKAGRQQREKKPQ